MKKIIYIALFFSFYSKLYGIDTLKYRIIGNEYDNVAEDIIKCADKGYLIVGKTYVSDEKKSDVYLLKLDSNFNKIWSFAYGHSNLEGANAVVETKDHHFILSGYSNSFGNLGYDLYLLCVDSNGLFLWEKNYGGNDWDFAHDIIQTYDNHFIIVGETFSYGKGQNDAYVIKIDALGDTLWTKIYGKSKQDAAYSIIEASDSMVYITGNTFTESSDSLDILCLVLDKNHDFLTLFEIGGDRTEIAYDIIEAKNGDLIFAGATNKFNTRNDLNQYVVRTDKLGNIIWEVQGADNDNVGAINLQDELYSVAENDVELLLAGGYTQTYGYTFSKDMNIQQWDFYGNFRGNHALGLQYEDWVKKVISVGSNFVFVANTHSFGSGNSDIIIGYNFSDMATPYEVKFLPVILDTFIVSVENNQTVNVILENSKNHIFPNPFLDRITIAGNTQKITIYNVLGDIVYKHNSKTTDSFVIDLSYLKPGSYFVQFNTSAKPIHIIKQAD